MAAIAVEVSSSSESMAPRAAMMAVTPQMEEPMASRLVSLGDRRKMRPSRVITERDRTSSTATSTSERPPGCAEKTVQQYGAHQHDAQLEP